MDPDNLVIKLILTGWRGGDGGGHFPALWQLKKKENEKKKTLNLLQPGIPHFRWTRFHSVITHASLSAVSHDTHGKRSPQHSRLRASSMPRLRPVCSQFFFFPFFLAFREAGRWSSNVPCSLLTSLLDVQSGLIWTRSSSLFPPLNTGTKPVGCKIRHLAHLIPASFHFHPSHSVLAGKCRG